MSPNCPICGRFCRRVTMYDANKVEADNATVAILFGEDDVFRCCRWVYKRVLRDGTIFFHSWGK